MRLSALRCFLLVSVVWFAFAPDRGRGQTVVIPAFDVGTAAFSNTVGPVDVAAGSDGTFVVIWGEYSTFPRESAEHAVTRHFAADGTALGAAVKVDTTAHVIDPAISSDSRGGYVAGWNWIRNGQIYTFFGDLLDAGGVSRSGEFQLSLLNGVGTVFGSPLGLPSGSVFVWDQFGLWGRLLDPSGARRGGDFLISALSSGVYRSHVAATADGGFVAVWWDFYSTPPGVWIRIFGPNAQPRSEPLLIIPESTGFLRVAGSPLGGFTVVSGQSNPQSSAPSEIWALRFATDGTFLGKTVVGASTGYWIDFDPVFDAQGNLYLPWTEYFLNGPQPVIRARVLLPDGTPAGAAVQITNEPGSGVRAARLQNGNFVNVWSVSGRARGNVVALCGPGVSACGDGIVQAGCEQCDNGAANSDNVPDACRTDCRLPRCGDNVIDTGEQCDDGNNQSCDGCSADCRIEAGAICGDGTLNRACGEECDQGAANSDTTPDACRTDCRLPRCGDGVLDSGEQCDDGNTRNCDGCNFACQVETVPPGADTICDPPSYAGLSSAEAGLFEAGRAHFVRAESATTGLGPVFNGASCAECHNQPTVGGSSARFVTRIGSPGSGGLGFDDLASVGGPLIQAFGITTPVCSVPGEVVPAQATFISRRDTPPLFGMGLIDAIPDSEILRNEDPQDRNHDGISGRANRVLGKVARFGWKAQVATLGDFAAEAYRDEIGITNPAFPAENAPQGGAVTCDAVPDPEDDGTGVAQFTDFMRRLAPLPGHASPLVLRGRGVFRLLRCQKCHTDQLRAAIAPIPALRGRKIPLYSDLLLHDMGPDLADGIQQGSASGSEFRTAPLWGVRYTAPYLHDGRAATLEDAIAAHGGEAQAARDRFLALAPERRAALIAFLNSL
jgi:cysteine-rich repeat protein